MTPDLDPSPHVCPRCLEDLGSPRCCGLPYAHLAPDVTLDDRAQGWLAVFGGPPQGLLAAYYTEEAPWTS